MKLRGNFVAGILAITLTLTAGVFNVAGNTFCNMDESGGEKGKETQRKAALAAALFFDGAANTFQMFASIERHLAGDKNALGQARKLSGQSIEQLNRSVQAFQALGTDKKAMELIDSILQQLKRDDYVKALGLARYSMESPIGNQILSVFGKSSGGEVLQACANSVKGLVEKDQVMGQVYATVAAGKSPSSENVWAAIAQWNEVLIRGRIVSSIFRASATYKPVERR